MWSAMFLYSITASFFLFTISYIEAEPEYWEHSMGDKFEGDIDITCNEVEEYYGTDIAEEAKMQGTCTDENEGDRNFLRRRMKKDGDNRVEINALKTDRLWMTRKNGKVQIPYLIRPGDYNSSTEDYIRNQLDLLQIQSGVVDFFKRTTEESYILVMNLSGCFSSVGMRAKNFQPQRLSLRYPGCISPGIIQHEFLHALGFFHEQSRPDRDEYITVNYENINPQFRSNFAKRINAESLGSPYDYRSVMHYGNRAFSMNGLPTIDSKGNRLGNRRASESDIIQLRLMYQCETGPRNLEEYESDPCSSECKCWESAQGCDGNDGACQGDLICQNDTCVTRPPTLSPLPTINPSPSPTPKPSSTSVPSLSPSDVPSQYEPEPITGSSSSTISSDSDPPADLPENDKTSVSSLSPIDAPSQSESEAIAENFSPTVSPGLDPSTNAPKQDEKKNKKGEKNTSVSSLSPIDAPSQSESEPITENSSPTVSPDSDPSTNAPKKDEKKNKKGEKNTSVSSLSPMDAPSESESEPITENSSPTVSPNSDPSTNAPKQDEKKKKKKHKHGKRSSP